MIHVRTKVQRPAAELVAQLGEFSSATIHEAQGRRGAIDSVIKPIDRSMSFCGPAVTVLLQPGDNWMIHVAAEQVRPGDVLVAACTTESEDGFFGELLATSLKAHGCAGLVIDGFKHLPSLGQAVNVGNWRFEVVDLDGRRVDKVLASRTTGTHRPARRASAG